MDSIKLLDLIKRSSEYLSKHGIENSRFEAELLVSSFYKIGRLDLYLQFDKPVTASERDQLRGWLVRRKEGEPIQHIVGYSGFMGYDFKVNRDVLIPRFDTEAIVERVVNYSGDKALKILDIGVGSGAIICSVLKISTNCRGVGIDISKEAVAIADENSKFLGVDDRVQFFVQDFFKLERVKEKFDIVISNPPYIGVDEMDGLDREVGSFEPRLALTDEGDGLSFYRRIEKVLPALLKKDGRFFLEYGYKQKDSIEEIFRENYSYEIIKDLSGNFRGIEGWFKG